MKLALLMKVSKKWFLFISIYRHIYVYCMCMIASCGEEGVGSCGSEIIDISEPRDMGVRN